MDLRAKEKMQQQQSISLAYRDVSDATLIKIRECNRQQDMKYTIGQLTITEDMLMNNDIKFTDEQKTLVQQILIDYFYHIVAFGIRHSFDNYKLSTLFSIGKDLLFHSMRQKLTIQDSFIYCKEILIQHSVHRPPRSVEIFNLEDYRKISEYFFKTFFQNYKLYQYTFAKQQVANITMKTMDSLISQPFQTKSLTGTIIDEEWQEKKRKELETKQLEEARLLEEEQKLAREKLEQEKRQKEEEEKAKAEATIANLHPQIREKLETLKQSLEQYTVEKFGDAQKSVQNMLDELAKIKKK